MKIFISGVAGYLGSKIAEMLLNSRYEVIGVDNFFYNNQQSIFHLLPKKSFDFHQRDVREDASDLTKECDIILPLAALVGAPICDKYPELAKEINYESIKNLK